MATYGKINEFDESTEEWSQYVDRMNHYFEANEISDAGKQRAIFLSVCGSKTYELICDLLAPDAPSAKTFDELTGLVKSHVQPKPSEIVQRYKFNSCFRASGQSVSDYVVKLRHIATDCKFGDTLNLMSRDRLVCGVNDDRIQRRLLSEKDLTFDKALATAKAMEEATKNVADLNLHSVPVNMVNSGTHKQQQGRTEGRTERKECWRCGGKSHWPSECYFKDAECYNCHSKGHVTKRCIKAKQQKPKESRSQNLPQRGGNVDRKGLRQKYLEEDDTQGEFEEEYALYRMGERKEKPIVTKFEINGVGVPMEIDTGASKSVLSEETCRKVMGEIKPTSVILRTNTGELIPIAGESELEVIYNGAQSKPLKAVIVKGNGPNLMGRDWLREIQLDWQELLYMRLFDETEVLKGYEEVFDGKLGTYTGAKAQIHVDDNAVPKYFKARSVPFALKDKIGNELDRMENDGTIERVQYSQWAAPIVPLVKSDGTSIRICGDYKVTVNAVSTTDTYPIPKPEDLFANLKGKYFTKLDMSNAYQQIELEEESKQFTTINTHKGLYRYNRLCFGISSSPGIFQRVMDNILQGLEGVRVCVDDILIAGESGSEHNRILREVLARLKAAGLKLKKSKCIFMASEIVYLGHKISEKGVEPLMDKVSAIEEMERPTDKKELQSYLGLINYYARFLPNISSVLVPLYLLLKKDEEFQWEKEQEEAWLRSKNILLVGSFGPF